MTFKQEERTIKNPNKKLLQGLENPECRRKEWGFRTYFPHSDIFTDKARRCQVETKYDESEVLLINENEYVPPKDPVFRDSELLHG